MSKQRYILNADDLVSDSFFTSKNADTMVAGINANASKVWSVRRGGTGNGEFTHGKLLVYDAVARRIVSSDYDPLSAVIPAHNHDDRYYLKEDTNNLFHSVVSGKGKVHWDNVAAKPGFVSPTDVHRMGFLLQTRQVMFINSSAALPNNQEWKDFDVHDYGISRAPTNAGRQIVAAILAITGWVDGPDIYPAYSICHLQARQYGNPATEANMHTIHASGTEDRIGLGGTLIVPTDSVGRWQMRFTNIFYGQVWVNITGVVTQLPPA